MVSYTNDGAKGQVFTVSPTISSGKRLLDDSIFNSYEWDSSPIEIKPNLGYRPVTLLPDLGNVKGNIENVLGVGLVLLIIMIFKK